MNNLSTFKRQKGFTLVELLVVIGILGILMVGSLVALNPIGRFNSAKDANAKAGVDQVSTALQAYLAANSAYPTTAQTYSVMVGTGKELTVWPTGPSGSALTYVGNASGTNAAVYFALLNNDTTSTGCTVSGSPCTHWCYMTSTGKAGPVTGTSACTAP